MTLSLTLSLTLTPTPTPTPTPALPLPLPLPLPLTRPDGWTAVTKDGQPSAQFEHTLLVNETGVEVLTARLPTSPLLWWEAEGRPLRC